MREKDGHARPGRPGRTHALVRLHSVWRRRRVGFDVSESGRAYCTAPSERNNQPFAGPRTTRRRRTGYRASERATERGDIRMGKDVSRCQRCALYAQRRRRRSPMRGLKEGRAESACPSLGCCRGQEGCSIRRRKDPARAFRSIRIRDGTGSQGTHALYPPAAGGRASKQAERGEGGGAEPTTRPGSDAALTLAVRRRRRMPAIIFVVNGRRRRRRRRRR
jgi:hypothetical protein